MSEVPEADAQEQALSADPDEAELEAPSQTHAQAEAAEGDLLEQEIAVPVDDEYR